MAVVCVHAAAAQLHHARPQAAQAGQVELGITVGAANPFGLGWREHPVSANHLPAGGVAHQQMLTVVVKQIHVMARYFDRQSRAHLGGKHIKSQALGFPDVVLVPGPLNHNFAGGRR